ncbi:MAG: glycosyl transferase, partial [Chloroflexota bacterium]
GQYTHAATWVIWAFAALGDGDRATSLFQMINPILHANTPDKVSIYKVEPYVIAADVYSMPPHVGRGGWTWYTGSASWMVRLGIEAILGIKREGQFLKISPCIPKHWPGFSIKYRFGDSLYNIQVYNHQKVNSGVIEISLDGFILSNPNILLVDDKKDHFIVVKMGQNIATED